MIREQTRKSVSVRGLEIFPPIALAPMVGLSHSALRTLLHEIGGVGLYYTEMLAAQRLPHENENISPLLVKSAVEQPLIYQIVTGEEAKIQPAVDKLHQVGADGIDLNLGCPAPTQRRKGAGSSLAGNQPQLLRILAALRRCTELPLSVKIRLGKVVDVERLRLFCSMLETEGVDMITLHARLDREKFCRKPRWWVAGEVKDALKVPLFVNGGIFNVEDAASCLNQSGADGIMVGRGALENPWLCAQIAKEIYKIPQTPALQDKVSMYWRFVELVEERFSKERQLGRLKRFTHYYMASFQFGHHLAAAVQSSSSVEEAKCKAESFFSKQRDSV